MYESSAGAAICVGSKLVVGVAVAVGVVLLVVVAVTVVVVVVVWHRRKACVLRLPARLRCEAGTHIRILVKPYINMMRFEMRFELAF